MRFLTVKKLLFLILLIAFVLRFFMLGAVPVGVSLDEASLGYNAYSILKTGRDEYGQKFPAAFKAFGEYKAPLLIYITVPFIALFDLNEFSVRFPPALFGLLTVYCVYLLAHLIYKKRETALACAFFLSIIPWHLQFTRIAYEGSVTVFLLTLATYCFIKSFDNSKYYVFSILFFVSSFYSHYAVRGFVPLFVFLLTFIYFKKVISFKKHLLLAIIAGFIAFLPLIPSIISQEGLQRARYISFTTDKGLTFSINEKRAEHGWNDLKFPLPSKGLHNKATEYTRRFLENYVSHFDLSFFLVKGDEDKIFTTPFTGILLFTFLPLLCIGLFSLFKDKNPYKWIIITWLLLAPVPSSLTRLSASANRSFIMVIPVSLILGLGLVYFLNGLKKFKKIIVTLFLIVLFFEYINYLDGYYIHNRIKNAGDMRIGSEELVTKVQSLSSNYNQVWISNKSDNYIHFLFYMKYPPRQYQNQAQRGTLDEYGFGTVTGFDKYNFDRIPKFFDFSQNILYVAKAGEEPKGIKPIYELLNPDGLINSVVFDTETVKTYCQMCNVLLMPEGINIYGDISQDSKQETK